jgi:hypothetical protein
MEDVGALMLEEHSDADDSYDEEYNSDYEAGASLYADLAGTEYGIPRTGPQLIVQGPSPASSSHQLSTRMLG